MGSLFALMFGTSLSIWADQIVVSTTVPDGQTRPEHLFTMQSGNGLFANATTAPTQTEANKGLFAFYAVPNKAGAYYIYSHSAKQWLSYQRAAGYNNGLSFVKMTPKLEEKAYFIRTELELKGVNDVDLFNIIPMVYNVDTRKAGSTPKAIGNLLDGARSAVASYYHSGYTGGQHENNSFSFVAPNSGTFTLRVFVENETESIDATSTISAKVFSPKEGAVISSDIVGIQGRWSRNTTLAAGETWKVSAVVGLVAQDGNQHEADLTKTQKRRSFLAYSERERAVPWRANPVYISWYELNINRNNDPDPTKNMTADQVLDVLNHWKTDMYDRYGIAAKNFVIDDGWDNYGTWTFHKKFPNEMKDIAAAAKEMQAGVGAWLGPVGGYGQSGSVCSSSIRYNCTRESRLLYLMKFSYSPWPDKL